MFNISRKQITKYTAQIFFCLIGLFLARETYLTITGFAAFGGPIPFNLRFHLKSALFALLVWLPLILAIPLAHAPMKFRRIFAVWQLPGFLGLFLVLLVFSADAPKLFDASGSLDNNPDSLYSIIKGIAYVSCLVIAIGYFVIKLFFPTKESRKLK